MRTIPIAALAFAVASLSPAGADGQPTSRPAAINWPVMLKSMPRELQPPAGQTMTKAEAEAAAKWLQAELVSNRTFNFASATFVYEGGVDRLATAKGMAVGAFGAHWYLSTTCKLTPAADRSASRDRSHQQWKISGGIEKAEAKAAGSKEDPSIVIEIVLAETSAAKVRQR